MSYRVRRDLPDNQRVQLKQTTLRECKQELRDKKRKWDEVAEVGGFAGGEPYKVELKDKRLTVTRNGEVVDCYIIERSK